ncbi:copper resistance protein CopC [Pseudarthrobacter sp. AL07]|uniref:copper resistance CopC/CopD family protein n=1 Tax=unclassified Pseudarthrobacter TaxID=2647000 RepID=UPI00249B7305|nr:MULTISPECIES: copper resistance protein CopC [unclassified Pseudarthrobacter]MDI3195235.1 copper resistance protein CopC [Pseudarthrobacter sp. AL20]MDI3209301.1 copper resistance protein CopC [Pseudarthrobacter sp. AL07]
MTRRAPRRPHRLGRAAALLAATAGLVFAGLLSAVPASAHANLLFSAPAADSTAATAPETLTLLFDEPVTTAGTPVTLVGPQGSRSLGAARLSHENRALEIPVPGPGAPGIYTVQWQVTAGDGDVMSGSYRYAIGPSATALGGGQATDTQGSWQTTVLRLLMFTALALALGEQAGIRLLGRLRGALAGPRTVTVWACLLGVAAATGLAVLLLGNGSLTAGLTRPVPDALTGSRPGILALVELGGFALAAAVALTRRRAWLWLPLAAVIGAEALRAHPQLADPALGIPLTVVHLAAAILWTGMLVHILRTLIHWRHHRDLSREALRAYSRTAVWLFTAVVLTGLGTALILVPPDALLTTDYGRVLLAKTVLVAAAAGLALAARRLLRRESVLERISRPARAEAAALSIVLVVSAVLTVLPVPGSAAAPLAFPPPATGPVVPAAALAGEIGVNARASSGQLVIQLTVPELTDASGTIVSTQTGLTGSLAGPAGETAELTFRRCGEGCFFSPATWTDGTSRLTLTPTSGTWNVKPAALAITWPAVPAEDLLREAVTAMKAVPAFTLHELVTSDTSQGLGTPRSFQSNGQDFIRRALYASGRATTATRLDDEDGNRRLVLSYPAENAVLELTLAPDGRILRESQTAPHHLVTRTLIYPEPEAHHD